MRRDVWRFSTIKMIAIFQRELFGGAGVRAFDTVPPATEWQYVRSRRVSVPVRGKLLRAVRFCAGHIVLLRAVELNVVEFPRLVLLCDEFPAAISHRPVAFVFPEDWI